MVRRERHQGAGAVERLEAEEGVAEWQHGRLISRSKGSASASARSWRSTACRSTLPQGELLTILGPSGSGKTTLLKVVAGFETPDAGPVLVDGADITALPPAQRDIGMVFQNYALFPHLSVARNVAFPLEMRNVAKAEIDRAVAEALELVELAGYERAPAAPALGRPAAARGAGPRHRLQPAPAAARRAVRRARPQAARDHAARGAPPAAPARPDHHLHHPRPGRGAGPVRPHRGDEQGRDPAGRLDDRDLRAAGQRFRRRLHGREQHLPRHGDRGRLGHARGRPRRSRSQRHAPAAFGCPRADAAGALFSHGGGQPLTGAVVEAVYLGSSFKLRLACDVGLDLIVRQPARGAAAATGERVAVGIELSLSTPYRGCTALDRRPSTTRRSRWLQPPREPIVCSRPAFCPALPALFCCSLFFLLPVVRMLGFSSKQALSLVRQGVGRAPYSAYSGPPSRLRFLVTAICLCSAIRSAS